jgi:type I restriction enzyme S subunit
LDHYFSRDFNLNSYLQPIVRKGAKNDMKVNNANVLGGEICVPKIEEQKKITEFLSSLDDLIAAHSQKLDALKTHKKGLMQQLFPREGETVPRLRFPEFQDAGEWKAKHLEIFIEEFRKKSVAQDEYEVLTSARNGLVRQRDYYDNDRITERDNIGFNVIPPNYVTYRSRSDDRHFYFNENCLGITGIVSVYYPVFRVINGSNKFFIELLSFFSELVGKYSVGTSQTVLSLNQLGRIRLPIPIETEQHRIASCLSSLDDLIAAQCQKLDALKVHKKGLMQQLFPSTEAGA